MLAPTDQDLIAAGDEAVSRLRWMLRLDTTNPPGNELPLVEQLAAELTREGLQPQVLVPAPNRANLVVRLRGDGSQRPLLLLSHLDVVPAEPSQWTHPPFAGEVADGLIYGRGAVDSKLTTAVHMQVLLACKRLEVPLKRDLVLVAAADEERGAVQGMAWMVEKHPEVFDAEYGINEAGGFALLIDGKPVYTCQVAEKGGADLDLVVKGTPGHSSVPHGDNAIVHLGRVLQQLAGKLPHRVPDSVRAFFQGAAAAQARPETAGLLRAVLREDRCEAALKALPVGEPTRLMFDAMVRNTCAPTILEAGLKRNVIPSNATVQLSGRPLPGVDEASFLQEVRDLMAANGGLGDVELELHRFRTGIEYDHRTPLFGAMADALRIRDPDAILVPYMQTGGTDAHLLAGYDMVIYGFLPMRHEPGMDFFQLCHGHDERVSVENVHFAVAVIGDAVGSLNGL